MSRRPHKFTPSDVARVFKGTAKAGIPVEQVRAEIDPATGKIIIMVGAPIQSGPDASEWDGAVCE